MQHIVVVAAHSITRAGYQAVLHACAPGTSVRCTDSIRDCAEIAARHQVALVILDLPMPKQDDLRAVKKLTGDHPNLQVLVAGDFTIQKSVQQLLNAGATGFLSTQKSTPELVGNVQSVLSGTQHPKTGFTARAASSNRNKKIGHSPCETLSRREIEVFGKMAAGQKISAIGSDLGLSTKTISTYRGRILIKMGFCSNAEITRYALINGIIT